MRHSQASQDELPSFADTLRALLVAHSPREGRWTSKALADKVGVSDAYVRRWLGGSRLPPSDYLKIIAKVLHLSREELARLEDAYLTERRRSPERARTRLAGTLGLGQLVRRADPAQLTALIQGIPDHLKTDPRPPTSTLESVDAVNETVIRLFYTAATKVPPAPGRDTIYLTYNGPQTATAGGGAATGRWFRTALRLALQAGWHVIQLIRLDRNVPRSVGLVEAMQVYLGTHGTYSPFYFKEYGTLPVPDGLCLVPGIGGMILVATSQPDRIDAGLYLQDQAQLDLLVRHIREFIDSGVVAPLLLSYPAYPAGKVDYDEALLAAEQKLGGRFFVKDGLSALTRPVRFYEQRDSYWLVGRLAEEQDRSIRVYLGRQEAFRTDMARGHRWRDICPKRAVEALAVGGRYARDDMPSLREQKEPASPHDRWDHLSNVVNLLDEYPAYELALLDEGEEPSAIRTFWETVGDHTVLLETWRPRDDGREEIVYLKISEATIAHAFRDYGENLWKRVAPRNTDKAEVRAWLVQQLRELQQRHPAELKDLLIPG